MASSAQSPRTYVNGYRQFPWTYDYVYEYAARHTATARGGTRQRLGRVCGRHRAPLSGLSTTANQRIITTPKITVDYMNVVLQVCVAISTPPLSRLNYEHLSPVPSVQTATTSRP